MEDPLPLYHRPQDSSTPGKTVLPWRQVNILAIYTGLNHEFTLSELVAVANSTDLLHLRTFPSVENTITYLKVLQCLEKQFSHELQSTFWPFTLDQFMNRDFLSPCSGKFTVWLHLDIFSPMEDALPQTTRLLDIWKAGFAMKASQHSGRLYWIKPRTDTFWVHNSDTWCCLTPTGHVSTYGRRSTMDNKALQHSENQYCYEQQSWVSEWVVS